ncbi:VOC family protein [Aeromicrobium halocynthiae]|uniref:VOC family protein n=1 Tax=Aeromicrobium halocynthiae TaxID=560557 RepID=A0ABN2VXX4_9ACTN
MPRAAHPLVAYKDLCIDVNDLGAGLDFWAPVLGLDVVPDEDDPTGVHLEGPTPRHTVWPCAVPEPRTVKNRVHLDVHAADAVPEGTEPLSAPGQFPWQVVAGPEGDELCVFVREEVPTYRLYEVVVDCADHAGTSAWWQALWGGRLEHDARGFSWIDDAPGMPFDAFSFVPVPEPKTVKNRVHWDVTLVPGATVADLEAVGARVLRAPDDEISWTVMADPEDNEFCVFEEP